MKNGINALIPIDYFGVLINQAPSDFQSAQSWRGRFLSALGSNPPEFVWSTIEVKSSEADKVTGDGTLSPPIYAIPPGKSLSGFEISSPQPPGVVQFFAQGFTQVATSTPIPGNDEPVPSCPAWDFENPQLQTQVTGVTTGPSDPATISVTIRAREESGLRHCKAINPKKPTGKISVLILSTHDFDASQINVSSVVFGPGYATSIASKLVQTGRGEKIGSDERADWERKFESFHPEHGDRKNVHPKNLLLTFDVKSLDVQCGLDQGLFLRGMTNSGQQIVGAISSNFAGCGAKDFGKHKHHPFPFKWWKKNQSKR
jgi:hypothetical protein